MINENHSFHQSDRDIIDEEDDDIIGSDTESINNKEDEMRNMENGAIDENISFGNNFNQRNSPKSFKNKKKSLRFSDESNKNFSSIMDKTDEILNKKKRHLVLEDLENREKSKLACLIRKKYTALMKDSIIVRGTRKKFSFCESLKNISKNIFYELTGQIAQAVVSVISIFLYIFSTYYPDYSQLSQLTGSEYQIVNSIKWSEFTIALLINIDWIVNFLKAKRKWKFVFNFLNILDFIMVLSVYLNFFIISLKYLGFLRIFRMIRIMRIFRLFKLVHVSNKDGSEQKKVEINRRLISSILTILSVVFVATGIVHYLSNTFPTYFGIVIPLLHSYQCQSGNDFVYNQLTPDLTSVELNLRCADGDPLVLKHGVLTFDLAFYYMVITMATVGYGDIYPTTSAMRILIGIFVIISIITISRQTSEINDIIQISTTYQIPYQLTKGVKHVILTGFFNKSSLIRFLNEFYHVDHYQKSQNIKIVIIQNQSPDKDIQSVLLDPKYEENIHFINGDIFSDNIMEISRAQTASAIILVSDQNHPEATKNDQFLILACKAFSQCSQANLYVQFLYSQSLLHDWADWDFACSSSQIKMSIIAINGFISGFTAMMMNLSSSLSSIINFDYRKRPWMHEYVYGASQEIYIVNVPKDFQFSLSFADFILKSYLESGSLIIGIKKKVYYQDDRDIFYYVYLLNPVNVTINNEDAIVVISNDFESALSIFDSQYRNSKKKSFKIHNLENEAGKEKEEFNYFINNIKEENLLISNLEKNKNFKNVDENNTKINSNWKRFESFPINTNKYKIPNLFRDQQHFKIWENNPDEFDSYFLDHYLIFCQEVQLWEFMKSFDTFYSEIIFFVCDHPPSHHWEILVKSYPNIIFIECSYSDFDDLQKLVLEAAKHVFILSYSVENSNVSDSAILPLVKIIEENFPNCKYTVELTDEMNLKYMNNEGDVDRHINNVLDDSKVNSMRDTDIESKKRKELSNSQMTKFPVRLWPKYAKGDIFFSSSLDSLTAFGFHNDGVLEVISKLLGLSSVIRNKNMIENSNLSMFRYVGNRRSYTYKNIIKNFLKLNPPLIPLAIYRMRTDDNVLKNEYPYIITNPKNRLDLNRFDKIICIGRPQENLFDHFKLQNYSVDDEENRPDLVRTQEKILSYKFKEKRPENLINKNKNNEPIKFIKHLNEIELIEKLKEELENLKFLTKSNRNSDIVNNYENYLAKPKHSIANFNVIEEENHVVGARDENNFKDKLETSQDEDLSIVVNKNIYELIDNKNNDNLEKVEDLRENKPNSISLVEAFEIPGNDIIKTNNQYN